MKIDIPDELYDSFVTLLEFGLNYAEPSRFNWSSVEKETAEWVYNLIEEHRNQEC